MPLLAQGARLWRRTYLSHGRQRCYSSAVSARYTILCAAALPGASSSTAFGSRVGSAPRMLVNPDARRCRHRDRDITVSVTATVAGALPPRLALGWAPPHKRRDLHRHLTGSCTDKLSTVRGVSLFTASGLGLASRTPDATAICAAIFSAACAFGG